MTIFHFALSVIYYICIVYLLLLHDYLLLPSFHLGLSLPFCILPGICASGYGHNSLGLNPLGQNPSSLLYDKPLDLMTTMDNPPPISHTSLLSTCLYHNSLVLRMLFHCALICEELTPAWSNSKVITNECTHNIKTDIDILQK